LVAIVLAKTHAYHNYSHFPNNSLKLKTFLLITLSILAFGIINVKIPTVEGASTIVQIIDVQIPQIATQQGFIMPLNVTLTNPDPLSETVNIQINANNTSIFSSTATLNARQTQTVPCYFNTSILTIGNYTITTTVTTTTISGSTPQVSAAQTGVTYVGDLNGDFTVNYKDLTLFVSSYIQYQNNQITNPACDYNIDSKINYRDLTLYVLAYSQYSTMGNRINGLWTQTGSDTTTSQCEFYLSKDISYIYVDTGYWKSDGSIFYFISPSEIQSAVANAHAAGLKIYPWVTSQSSYGDIISIGTSSLRQNAFNTMVGLVQTYGFDGMADDVEQLDYTALSDYVAYFNGAALAMHSVGKQYFAAVVSYLPETLGSSLFSQIKVDRIQPMLYCYPYYPYTSSNPIFTYEYVQSKFKEQMDFTLRYSSSPVGLAIHFDLVSYGKLADATAWIDQQIVIGTPTAKLVGMDIFWFDGMTQSQWNSWTNWSTKN